VANGSGHEGPARADRIRNESDKHARHLQRMVDEERARGELPSYTDEGDTELTANRHGLRIKSTFPRIARIIVGAGLAFFLVCCGVALVAHFWAR
jgi:hypothetical protein